MFVTRIVLCVAIALVLTTAAAARPFPEVIDLPTGFQPEGIAIGGGTTSSSARSRAEGSTAAT